MSVFGEGGGQNEKQGWRATEGWGLMDTKKFGLSSEGNGDPWAGFEDTLIWLVTSSNVGELKAKMMT